jgi:hypothetical protein
MCRTDFIELIKKEREQAKFRGEEEDKLEQQARLENIDGSQRSDDESRNSTVSEESKESQHSSYISSRNSSRIEYNPNADVANAIQQNSISDNDVRSLSQSEYAFLDEVHGKSQNFHFNL